MLLAFACSNHKSIRKEVLFSVLARKDDIDGDQVYEVEGLNVLKAAVIYGANGSGKSNFINAIAFVRSLVLNSIIHQPGQGIRQIPHKLDGFNKESSYTIQFIINNIRYAFGFSLKNMLVTEEYLYYFPNNKQTKIFERSEETFSTGRKFKNKLSVCKDVLKPNRLLLSCAANFSNVQEIVDVYNFFNNDIVVYSPMNQNNWLNYSLYQMNNNPDTKAKILKFLNQLGTGIQDILISIDKMKLEPSELPSILSDDFKALLLQRDANVISAKVKFENFETDLMHEESMGIKKLFSILGPIIDIILNGKILICDELESSLHESLVYGLAKLFMETVTGNFAQLILTTHDTSLLNLDLFRRDQIWFTELTKEDRATDLYSLAEIKNVRKEENFEKGYIAGRYGAIPMLNLDFANIVSQM